MKVAFATQDLERVDAHFGWAKNIAIYELTPESYQFLEAVQFAGDLQEDGNEDKLLPKLDAIKDCVILVRRRHRRVRRGARRRAKYSSDESAAAGKNHRSSRETQVVLRGSPPPWLRKILSKGGARTFDFDEETANA